MEDGFFWYLYSSSPLLERRLFGISYQGTASYFGGSLNGPYSQRPALQTSEIHDHSYESVHITEEKMISYADQLIIKMFFYLHLFD